MGTTNYTYLSTLAPGTYFPTFDPTGILPANFVTSEVHTITPDSDIDYHIIVPIFTPFFSTGLDIVYKQNDTAAARTLVEGIDYTLSYQFLGASRGCAKAVYGGISLINPILAGKFTLNYHTLGGEWCVNLSEINEILANRIKNPRVTSWEQIVQLPNLFPVVDHLWNLQDLVGASEVVRSIDGISTAIKENVLSFTDTITGIHYLDKDNPHEVTKSQVGLGDVMNYGVASDIEATNPNVTNKYMTPESTYKVIESLKNETDPFPIYATDEEVNNIIKTTGFKGSYLNVAELVGSTYIVTLNGTTVTNGLFSLAFADINPLDAKISINGIVKPIVTESMVPIEAGEIIAGTVREFTATDNNWVLHGANKYLSIPFSHSSFDNIPQNSAVRMNNGGLALAVADNTSPNNSVIGFADSNSNQVVYNGILDGFTGLVTNVDYYLSPTTPGAITSTKPYIDAIKVGTAKSSTELFVNIVAAANNDNVPTGGAGDKVFYLDDKIITTNYTIPTNKNALSTGPISIETGAVIEIPSGCVWTIV